MSSAVSNRFMQAWLFVGLLFLAPFAWTAEEAPGGTEEVSVPATLASPRATVESFLGAMNDIKRGSPEAIERAVMTLDLAAVNPLVRKERGEHLAWTLLQVMDRTRVVDIARVPPRTEGKPWIFEQYRKGLVRITRQADGRWLFDRETMASLDAVMEELADRKRVAGLEGDDRHVPWNIRLQQSFPPVLRDTTFLLENWRWLGLLLTVLAGVIVDWVAILVLRTFTRQWLARCHDVYAEVSEDTLRPLGLMGMAIVWWLGINLLGLPETALLILLVAVKFLASISAVWAAYRLVDLVAAWLRVRAERTDNKIDDVLVPLIPRTMKIFVTAVGIVFVADNLNIDISGLLAGLGLGGLAFALAAKDMVQNLFGSVTVLLDRTFTVGDWIKVGGQEGTVERMGFRSTRVRTFYNSLVTIPNSVFITAEVDNMGARRYRRLSTKFGLTYDTPPDRIEAFCEGVRELVRQHPYMRDDYFHVYLNGLGNSALEVLVYVFWETPDWGTELRERHRFLLDCLRLAKRVGVEFAFPTQTLYLRQEEWHAPPDESSAQDAAHAQGRGHAVDIVAETTGLDVKPAPVKF